MNHIIEKGRKYSSVKIKGTHLTAVALIILIGSFYCDLMMQRAGVNDRAYLIFLLRISLVMLILIGSLCFVVRVEKYWITRFAIVMLSVVGLSLIQKEMSQAAWFKQFFIQENFLGLVGGNVALKFFSALCMLGLLIRLYPNDNASCVAFGNMKTKASAIHWLGIKDHEISWGRLSLISGVLISFGTMLLTWITVIGQLPAFRVGHWVEVLPMIVVLSVLNAFSEGVIYRLAILEPLIRYVPKDKIIMLSALIFGSYHYYGAPGGPIGVLMSSILGWYLARSMYETRGMLSSWIIHAMQDFVIFSLIILLGNGQ